MKKIKIGDIVRNVERKEFSQKGAIPRYSKEIHNIEKVNKGHSYVLDNGKLFKYYQLQPVNKVEEKPNIGYQKEKA